LRFVLTDTRNTTMGPVLRRRRRAGRPRASGQQYTRALRDSRAMAIHHGFALRSSEWGSRGDVGTVDYWGWIAVTRVQISFTRDSDVSQCGAAMTIGPLWNREARTLVVLPAFASRRAPPPTNHRARRSAGHALVGRANTSMDGGVGNMQQGAHPCSPC
jgi:hypothetical protein